MLNELNFMPILAIWCSLCPKNLEATAITFLTAILNLTHTLSNLLGFIVLWYLGIGRDNLEQVWQPLLIQNGYLLIMMTMIVFVDFP